MSFDTSIHYVTYDHNQDREHFPRPQKFPCELFLVNPTPTIFPGNH